MDSPVGLYNIPQQRTSQAFSSMDDLDAMVVAQKQLSGKSQRVHEALKQLSRIVNVCTDKYWQRFKRFRTITVGIQIQPLENRTFEDPVFK